MFKYPLLFCVYMCLSIVQYLNSFLFLLVFPSAREYLLHITSLYSYRATKWVNTINYCVFNK